MHKICQDYHKHNLSINMDITKNTIKSEKFGKWGEFIINVYNIIQISLIITKGKIFVIPTFIQWHSIEFKGLQKVISSFNNNESLNKFVIDLKVSPFCLTGQLWENLTNHEII